MYEQEHDYGYLGILTGIFIFAGIGVLLIYLGEREIKPKKPLHHCSGSLTCT